VSVLAIDEGAFTLKDHFHGIEVLSFQTFLEANPELAKRLEGRSVSETIFSIGPSALLGFAGDVSRDGWLVYADSDLFFFDSLSKYLGEFERTNVLITPHRHYPWNERRLAKYGRYNVGLVAFRNNEEGLRALRYWAESCLEWCYDRVEDDKYADQKYLERFQALVGGVTEDLSLGANLAPWNAGLTRLSRDLSGRVFVDGEPLVYFHAQGLQMRKNRWVLSHLKYFSLASSQLKNLVYRPYLKELEAWSGKPGFDAFGTARVPNGFLGKLSARLDYCISLITGQTIKVGSKSMWAPK
ncbi:MAG: hypothetical protein EB157_04090, partial [Euryarchaeota archaeon]|nr:hypothetical protein [Euryarchaeota archaeon]